MGNKKPQIVFLDAATMLGEDLSLDGFESLGDVKAYDRTPTGSFIDRAIDAQILVVNKVVIDKKVIEKLPNLQYVVVSATGYNNVDLDAAKARGILVSNVKGYSTESVVQQVFSLLLHALNRVADYNHQVQLGVWQDAPDFTFYNHTIRELNGKTLGIYGYGNIGKRVGEVASAFGMKVIAYHRNPKKLIHAAVDLVSEEDLWAQADIISLHAPLNEESKHVINKKNIAVMKEGVILINTARGGLINDADLADALLNGKVAFALIDTLSKEPPKEGHPLIGLENCIITPHQAWTSIEARSTLLDGVRGNIIAFLKGKPLNVLN